MGYAYVDASDGEADYGYINADFENVIACEYVYAENFSEDGYAVVADKSKKYFVIESGKSIAKGYDRNSYLSHYFCRIKDCYLSGNYMSLNDIAINIKRTEMY